MLKGDIIKEYQLLRGNMLTRQQANEMTKNASDALQATVNSYDTQIKSAIDSAITTEANKGLYTVQVISIIQILENTLNLESLNEDDLRTRIKQLVLANGFAYRQAILTKDEVLNYNDTISWA